MPTYQQPRHLQLLGHDGVHQRGLPILGLHSIDVGTVSQQQGSNTHGAPVRCHVQRDLPALVLTHQSHAQEGYNVRVRA